MRAASGRALLKLSFSSDHLPVLLEGVLLIERVLRIRPLVERKMERRPLRAVRRIGLHEREEKHADDHATILLLADLSDDRVGADPARGALRELLPRLRGHTLAADLEISHRLLRRNESRLR